MDDIDRGSFLDKTDWKSTVQRLFEHCLRVEGTPYYIKAVQSLVDATAAKFPGWDAKKDIETKIKELKKKYNKLWDNWISKNHSKHRWKKYNYRYNLEMEKHHEVYDYIFNTWSERGLTLWGRKAISGGKQIIYKDEEY